MSLLILTTGGTIDKIYFDAKSEFHVGEPQIGEILAEAGAGIPYRVRQLMRKDSLEMTAADRRKVREAITADEAESVVVTHGTDTMVETGRKLEGIAGKTIVLTGALHPARFRSSDAIFNIGMAVAAAQTMPPGVYIAMNGRVFPAAGVRKNRELNRFESLQEGE